MTECIPASFAFQDLGTRGVLADFNGGRITSDAGALLLRELDAKLSLLDAFAACFTDHRDPKRIEHSLNSLIKQRVFGLCLGYEDLNDHDRLRHDPLMAILVGVTDPLGQDRTRPADRGKALAGKSTLNRLELTPVGADDDSRYKKIVAHMSQIENYFPDVFIRQHTTPPSSSTLIDPTDGLPIQTQILSKGRCRNQDCRHTCEQPPHDILQFSGKPAMIAYFTCRVGNLLIPCRLLRRFAWRCAMVERWDTQGDAQGSARE